MCDGIVTDCYIKCSNKPFGNPVSDQHSNSCFTGDYKDLKILLTSKVQPSRSFDKELANATALSFVDGSSSYIILAPEGFTRKNKVNNFEKHKTMQVSSTTLSLGQPKAL